MSLLSGQTRRIREKTRDSLASMTPRDRMLLLGTGISLLLLIMIVSGIFINSKLKELNSDIKSSKEAFALLTQKRTTLEELRASVVQYEEKIEVHKSKKSTEKPIDRKKRKN